MDGLNALMEGFSTALTPQNLLYAVIDPRVRLT